MIQETKLRLELPMEWLGREHLLVVSQCALDCNKVADSGVHQHGLIQTTAESQVVSRRSA